MADETQAVAPASWADRLTLLVLTLILVVLAVGLVLLVLQTRTGQDDSLASAINSRDYQAVFLNNGQVYFGKLSAPGAGFYYLRHVYYLQSQASPQGTKLTRPKLIKLGNEIHGPEDLMVINRSQVLYVENLKPTGQVSRAIAGSSSR